MKLLLQSRNKITILLICLFPYFGSASQIKLAADGAEIVGKISKTEMNRITLIGDKIKSFKRNTEGYRFENDTATGDVYLDHLSGATDEPLNVYIISKRGYTYKLLLTPMDIPSEQIFINNPALTNHDEIANQKEPLPYTQEIVELMKAMKRGDMAPGYKVVTKRESYFSRNGMKLALLGTYKGSRYTGIIYEVKNKNKEPIALNERDFATKSVRAVKFDSPVIGAGDAINLYIVADRS